MRIPKKPEKPKLKTKEIIVYLSVEDLNKCPSVDSLRPLSVSVARSTMKDEINGFYFTHEDDVELELLHENNGPRVDYFVKMHMTETDRSYKHRVKSFESSMRKYREWINSKSHRISNEIKKRIKRLDVK